MKSFRESIRNIAAALLLPAVVAAAPATTTAVVAAEFIEVAPPYPAVHASTIVQLDDGTLAAAWFAGREEGDPEVAIWFARRSLRGWEKPVRVATARQADGSPVATWNPVLFQPPGQPLRLYYKTGVDPRHWRGAMIVSHDRGHHWSMPQALPAGVLGPIKNKPIVASDGSWLSPSSREEGTAEHNRWFIRMERSTDHGVNWRAESPVASPMGLEAIQPTLLTLADRRIELIARTRQGVLAASWSADNGVTWSPLVALELPNPNAGVDAVTLADGRHLLVYNHAAHWPDHPGNGPRWPLNVALSNDGVHWRNVLTLEAAPLPEGYAYPAVIQARDGLVHVTYTWNRTRIRHVVLDPRLIRAGSSELVASLQRCATACSLNP